MIFSVVPKVHGFGGILLLEFFFSGLGEVVSKNDVHEESSGTKSCTFLWDNTPNKL